MYYYQRRYETINYEDKYALKDSQANGLPIIRIEYSDECKILEMHLNYKEWKIQNLGRELDYLQNLISDKIKQQKSKLGEKALKDVIEDYNGWMLGHK